MTFKEFWLNTSVSKRDALAHAVGSTAGHLRNIAYGSRTCAESLAIAIERESAGSVRCEDLRPDVDWQFLRGSAPRGTRTAPDAAA